MRRHYDHGTADANAGALADELSPAGLDAWLDEADEDPTPGMLDEMWAQERVRREAEEHAADANRAA